MNYADNSCRLARDFGEGDDRVVLMLDRFSPGDRFQMILLGKPLKTGFDDQVTLRFGPNEAEQKVDYKPGTMADGRPAITTNSHIRIGDPVLIEEDPSGEFERYEDIGLAREAAVQYIFVDLPRRPDFFLDTGSLGAAFLAMRKCTDDLLRQWGLDASRHGKMKRPAVPKASPGQWMSSSDYPSQMREEGIEGLVHFRLVVGIDGKVTACHIQQSTRPKKFDDAVCSAMMRHARFSPAVDEAGQPMASYYINTVRFQNP